jgi:hypothetical protein
MIAHAGLRLRERADGESPIGNEWLQSQMAAIKELISQIETSGGASGGNA